MNYWMRGVSHSSWLRLLDVARDSINLMIGLLSDRASLSLFEDKASPRSMTIRRHIAYIFASNHCHSLNSPGSSRKVSSSREGSTDFGGNQF